VSRFLCNDLVDCGNKVVIFLFLFMGAIITDRRVTIELPWAYGCLLYLECFLILLSQHMINKFYLNASSELPLVTRHSMSRERWPDLLRVSQGETFVSSWNSLGVMGRICQGNIEYPPCLAKTRTNVAARKISSGIKCCRILAVGQEILILRHSVKQQLMTPHHPDGYWSGLRPKYPTSGMDFSEALLL
jgi:hypothetical protein